MPKYFSRLTLASAFLIILGTGINNAHAASAPTITSQPVNATVTAPSTATFSVAATGTPAPTYQWQQEATGGSTYTAISGATSASYTTPATSTANSGTKYECVVSNSGGSVTSAAATLTVNDIITGLKAWWKFDDGSGTSAMDSSGNGNTGTLINAPAWVTGKIGDALSFNGTNQYTTSTLSIALTNAVSFSTWVNTGTAGTVPLDSSISSSPGRDQFQIYIASTGSIRFGSDNGNFISCTGGSTTYTNNAWHLVTGVYNGSAIVGYIDGNQVCSQNASGNIGASTQVIQMGRDGLSGNGPSYYFKGSLDDVRVYNRALSAGDVALLYSAATAPVAPTITTQPANATVTAPATATFTVAATGTPAPTYQWQQEAPGATSYAAISGATSASYTTPATTTANSGTKYECVVSNSAGSVTSAAATLTVNPTPVAPTITSQPANATVTAPSTATFTIAATGTPAPTYQWQQEAPGATSYAAISGATSASYTTPATTTANSGTKYECVVSNSAGSVTSAAATLTVNPTPVAPTITSQPANATVTAPSTATFTIAATGTPAPTYQWQQEAPGATSFTAISGAMSASYTTPATTTANSGTQYECVVSNTSGSVTSNAATLTVNPTSTGPSITTQPVSVTVTAPATAIFSVTATGTPAPTYQWQQEAPGATSYTAISGATSVSYTTGATTTANSGTKYECVVSNSGGSVTSTAAILTVNDIITGLKAWWKFDDGSGTSAMDSSGNNNTGTLINNPAWVTGKINGALSFNGTNQYTTSTLSIALTNAVSFSTWVNTGTAGTVPLDSSISSSPGRDQFQIYIASTGSIRFGSDNGNFISCTGGSTTYTNNAWHLVTGVYNGSAIVGYIDGNQVCSQNASGNIGASTQVIQMGRDGLSGNGPSYYFKGSLDDVRVYNRALSAGDVALLYSAATAPVAPTITTQPANATVTAPATATFTVAATGTPAPTYQWQQEAPGATSYAAISGATSASYTTPATTTANSGTKYECVVTNSAGSVTSIAAILTVNPSSVAPTITTQPVNATVTAPATAIFTIAATGTPAPTYQWQQEAPGATSYAAISGATSASYTTPATTTPNSGTKYECVVSNSGGSVTSSAATLTVNPATVAPTITTQPVNATVTAPATATFTVAATGTPAPTYQWQQEAPGATSYTTISGATSTSYTTPATTTANSGTKYECVVSNTAGSVTSNPAILTVNPVVPSLPVVAITSPANNSSFTAGSNMTITATASETGGTISSVSFYNGTTLLGTSTTVPYSYTVTNISVGNYTLTAIATDVNSVSTTSSPVTVIVNTMPVVFIASPVNNSTLTTGSVGITAITGATMNNVAFYNGSTLLGTVTSNSQAFTYFWNNVPAGTYNLTAVATDSSGTMTTSSPVTITINAAPFSIDDNVLTTTDALSHITNYQYDNFNRLLKTTFADGSTVASAYDLFGNQISVTDQRGNALTKTYDPYERLIQTKDPLGGITQFSYDTEGHLLTLTDANGNPTSYTYDGDYRLLTQTNALNFTTAYTYDPVGNVSTRTDANGKATNYTYDALNRLTNTAYPDGTSVANAYDALGRRTSMTDSTGQTTYAYDALSRLLSKTSPGTNNTIAYTYDSEDNRLTSVDQNNRSISNTYDVLNRLVSVTDPNGTTSYGYDGDSDELSVTSPNGVTESYTYDALNRVLSAVNAKGVTVVSSFSNVYDIAGMITKKTLADGSWTAYIYDALNRLLEETRQTSSSIVYDYVYSYDIVGNRMIWTKNTTLGGFWSIDSLNMPPQVLTNMTNAGYGNTATPSQAVALTRNYTNDAANRLTNWNYAVNVGSSTFPVQTDTYTYDNNGNRLSKQAVLTGQASTPQQTAYAYDFENRLNQLSYVNIPNITGTQTDQLIYNGEGLRTQAIINSVTLNYLYDGFNILVERDGSGNTTKSYTRGLDYGGGIGSIIAQSYISSGTPVTQYYDYNDLGSTSDLTTPAGISAHSYSYDAFGNLLSPQASTDTNRYLFSSKEFDSRGGLQFFGARYYDPEIGRWLTQDPLGFMDGYNLYAYVDNSPVNYVDPSGLKKGDSWYGYNNKTFQAWFHRCWKGDADPDATKEEIEAAYEEWIRQGQPGPDSCRQRGTSCNDSNPSTQSNEPTTNQTMPSPIPSTTQSSISPPIPSPISSIYNDEKGTISANLKESN